MNTNDLIQKKIVISLNPDGKYSIKKSTVQNKYHEGSTIESSNFSQIISEGIKISFDGNLESDAPKYSENILQG